MEGQHTIKLAVESKPDLNHKCVWQLVIHLEWNLMQNYLHFCEYFKVCPWQIFTPLFNQHVTSLTMTEMTVQRLWKIRDFNECHINHLFFPWFLRFQVNISLKLLSSCKILPILSQKNHWGSTLRTSWCHLCDLYKIPFWFLLSRKKILQHLLYLYHHNTMTVLWGFTFFTKHKMTNFWQ